MLYYGFRQSLIFRKDKKSKGRVIPLSVIKYGYTLKEIAEYRSFNYTAVRRAIKKI